MTEHGRTVLRRDNREAHRRGSYASVGDLEAAIYDYLLQHNNSPKPFTWTKSAEDILARERRALNALDETRGNRQQASDLEH